MPLRFLLAASCLIAVVAGHGRIVDPPGRNTMWRQDFKNPVNYNDDEVYCGGFGVQYLKNDGKCGVCGDPWNEEVPRDNEHGGKYGNGIIGRTYVMGETIDVTIVLSTNHWGSFELKICSMDHDPEGIATQECMDERPLRVIAGHKGPKGGRGDEMDGARAAAAEARDSDANRDSWEEQGANVVGRRQHGKTDYVIAEETMRHNETFHYKVRLPKDLTCKRCVLQWTYTTGNSWGECEDGTSGMGCGPQEIFRNCADVQITTNTVGFPPLPVQRGSTALSSEEQYEEGKGEERSRLRGNAEELLSQNLRDFYQPQFADETEAQIGDGIITPYESSFV